MTDQILDPNNQYVLLIDTSREEAVVALVRGAVVVAERWWQAGPRAGQQAIAAVHDLLRGQRLKLADVRRIAVHAGPGRRQSALRAGVTVANVLAYAAGTELVCVSGKEVAAMAQEATTAAPVQGVRVKYEV